uniref:Cytokine receptor-like factor 2 n=1 Tax=Prolemur simus TaxID=1328070 RepID=A0A8C9AU11_PROSS
ISQNKLLRIRRKGLFWGWLGLSSGGRIWGVLQVQIIWFNFETVQVTWNASEYPGTNLTFLYRFDSGDTYDQCTNYILQHDLTAGCTLDAEQDEILYFSIENGTHPLLTQSHWISYYLKPGSPRDLSFLWQQEAVTVTCPDLLYDGFLYEVQHRSTFDTSWQSQEEETCNVTIEGLDTEKCYCFRARVKTTESSYGPDAYPSDWSEVTCWHGGQPTDLCPDKLLHPKFTRFILICSLVTLLTVCLLLVSLWKLGRVRELLIPSVPDPKSSFSGLFEQHHGNFQEWIKDTQNVALLQKMRSPGEQDCGPEDALIVQVAKTPGTVDALCPKTQHGESSGGSSRLPHLPPQGGDVVSLGGFTFVMSDSSYVTL